MTDHLDPLRRLLRYVGVILTVVSAALTGLFGLTQSNHLILQVLIALGLMMATIGSAYIWPFVADAVFSKRYWAAGVIAFFGVLFTGTDFTTNFGSLAWQRGSNIDEAKVAAAVYEDARDKVSDNAANLKLWNTQLSKLQAEAPWSATVTADGLRAQLDSAQKAVDLEAARGGCKTRCLDRMKEKAAIEEKIAVAERVSDLSKRIAATQRLVDDARAEAKATEKKDSGAAWQNASLASIATLSLEPSEAAMHWTDKGVSWFIAAFFTFGAMGCNMIGWYSRASRKEDGEPEPQVTRIPTASSVPAVPQTRTIIERVTETASKLQPVHHRTISLCHA